MELKVVFSEDPAFVLNRAGGFLSSQPVLHNLVLSILHTRVAQGDPGPLLDGNSTGRRCWCFTAVAPDIPSDADTDGTAGSDGNGRRDCGCGHPSARSQR